LLFCSGLPLTLTEEELKSEQYFGKYGSVQKVTLLKNIRQMSVYVTYGDACEASLAIIVDYRITKGDERFGVGQVPQTGVNIRDDKVLQIFFEKDRVQELA
jgi:hypothetical protein